MGSADDRVLLSQSAVHVFGHAKIGQLDLSTQGRVWVARGCGLASGWLWLASGRLAAGQQLASGLPVAIHSSRAGNPGHTQLAHRRP